MPFSSPCVLWCGAPSSSPFSAEPLVTSLAVLLLLFLLSKILLSSHGCCLLSSFTTPKFFCTAVPSSGVQTLHLHKKPAFFAVYIRRLRTSSDWSTGYHRRLDFPASAAFLLCQGLFCSSPAPPASRLGVHKKLGGHRARTADPICPRSVPNRTVP